MVEYNLEALEREYVGLEERLNDVESHWGRQHPEAIEIRKRLRELEPIVHPSGDEPALGIDTPAPEWSPQVGEEQLAALQQQVEALRSANDTALRQLNTALGEFTYGAGWDVPNALDMLVSAASQAVSVLQQALDATGKG